MNIKEWKKRRDEVVVRKYVSEKLTIKSIIADMAISEELVRHILGKRIKKHDKKSETTKTKSSEKSKS